jgi:hypothetical protein
MVDRTGELRPRLMVAAGAALTGCFWWTVLIPKVAPVTWSTQKATAA